MSFTQILYESRESFFTRSQQNGVCMQSSFIRKAGYMQTTHSYVHSATTIAVGNLIGTIGIGYIHLYADQVWLVVEVQLLNMLVLNLHLIVVIEIGGKRGQSQRWKK